MTVVLVHGVPETDAIWDPLRSELGRDDVVALSPPGFGAPVPGGFGATSDDYLDWLAGALPAIEGPIDLVGHDWGGGHVMRLVLTRPDLIRSWVADVGGALDPEYVWHDAARAWQTAGVGEQMIAQMVGAPRAEIAEQLVTAGVPSDVAERVAPAIDEDMGRCILSLYRSAAQPAMSEWGTELEKARQRPGLVIIATEDHYTGGEALARRSAARAGAKVALLPGLGHWWMCQDPKRGAEVLREFLNELE